MADPDAVRRLIGIARAARARDGRGPVLVVSAMSRVTDALLNIAAEAGASRSENALAQVEQLRERHLAMARAVVGNAAGDATGDVASDAAGAADLAALTSLVEQQFDDLVALIQALAVLREVSFRTLDVVAAMGELLSSRIIAAAVVHAGLPGEWVGRLAAPSSQTTTTRGHAR